MHRRASMLTAALALCPLAALAVPKAGQPAPDLALPTADGKPFALSSLRGRPVYLNFYATWCGPCNDEAPSIGKLSARYRSRGLMVLGVNELEDPHKAKAFLVKYHLPYGAIVDADGTAGKAYGALGLPLHVFIDRAGIVRTYRLGEMNADEIETAIKSIL